MQATFKTRVAGKEGSPTGIEVPASAIAELGGGKKPAVQVSLSGYQYPSTVAVMRGKFMIPLSAAHRAASGLKAGDPIEVVLELDTGPRLVEVPHDLDRALDKARLRDVFAALATSKRKEFARQVVEAKAEETRARRIAKIVEQLRALKSRK